MNTYFVPNLLSFQENFNLLKLVAYCQSYTLKSQIHFDQSFYVTSANIYLSIVWSLILVYKVAVAIIQIN